MTGKGETHSHSLSPLIRVHLHTIAPCEASLRAPPPPPSPRPPLWPSPFPSLSCNQWQEPRSLPASGLRPRDAQRVLVPQHVRLEVPLEGGPKGAQGARERLLARVRAHVLVQLGGERELPLAQVAPIAPLTRPRRRRGRRRAPDARGEGVVAPGLPVGHGWGMERGGAGRHPDAPGRGLHPRRESPHEDLLKTASITTFRAATTRDINTAAHRLENEKPPRHCWLLTPPPKAPHTPPSPAPWALQGAAWGPRMKGWEGEGGGRGRGYARLLFFQEVLDLLNVLLHWASVRPGAMH